LCPTTPIPFKFIQQMLCIKKVVSQNEGAIGAEEEGKKRLDIENLLTFHEIHCNNLLCLGHAIIWVKLHIYIEKYKLLRFFIFLSEFFYIR